MFCSKCSWPLIDSDLFCSWCGKAVFEILVRPYPIRIYIDAKPEPNALLTSAHILTNRSPRSIALDCVKAPNWLKVDPQKNVVIPPDKTLEVELKVQTEFVGSPPLRKDPLIFQPIAADSNNHSSFKQAKVEVQLWPTPAFTVRELTVFTKQPHAKSKLEIEVEADIKLVDLTFDPPYLSLEKNQLLEFRLGTSKIPIALNLPEPVKSGSHRVKYMAQLEGIKQPRTGIFDLIIRKPATLETTTSEDDSEKQVIPGTEDEIIFNIKNSGEADLRITTIIVSSPGSGLSINPINYPRLLKPDETGEVRLKVVVNGTATEGAHWFTLNFRGDDSVSRNLLVNVVDVAYPDFVAVDFGTTDSAVAVFRNERPHSLILEPNPADDPKIYSNILFVNYFAEREIKYDWFIGKSAKDLGLLRNNRERLIKGIKTKTGLLKPQKINFRAISETVSILPDEIIRFILMDLVRLTNKALHQRPVKFIISVPTRFTLRQKALLKETFTAAAHAHHLKVEVIETIDESLAAGLFYILTGGRLDEDMKTKTTYTLMILDFGGGTTDVTTFRVNQQLGPDNKARVKQVEIIGAWGDPTLGGEAITREIAELLASKFYGPLTGQEYEKKVTDLEEEAEAVKIAISELLTYLEAGKKHGPVDTAQLVTGVSPELRLKFANAMLLRPSDLSADLLTEYFQGYFDGTRGLELTVKRMGAERAEVRIKAQEVIDIFNRRLIAFEKELQVFMKRTLSEHDSPRSSDNRSPEDFKVDVMLLAGQSAQFPTVTEIFQPLSRRPLDFVKDASGNLALKECVSRGALFYIAAISGGYDFEIKGENRQWTRLGRRSGIGPEFEELIPWGAEYPYDKSEEFQIAKLSNVIGDKLSFQVRESLSLNDSYERDTREYKTFQLTLEDTSPLKYTCRLNVDTDGTVRAYCKINQQWIKMEPTQ